MARKKTETTQTDTLKNEIIGAAAQTIPEKETVAYANNVDAEKKDKQYIYAGVTLPGIKSNTVFTGDVPKILDVPFVRELVMPIETFAEFLKKKAVTSSREAFCYRKSAEYAENLK